VKTTRSANCPTSSFSLFGVIQTQPVPANGDDVALRRVEPHQAVAQPACALLAYFDTTGFPTVPGWAETPFKVFFSVGGEVAFVAHGAVQCGFCTPGMMVQAAHLLATRVQPDAAAVKRAIEGNLCRCTGYQKIVEAIVEAGQTLAAGDAT